MAARRSAQTGQTQDNESRTGAASVCRFHHEHTAEFAAIAANYENLTDRMDRLEDSIEKSIESLRLYLKEEYAQAIEFRISALSARLEASEKQISDMKKTLDGVSKKIVYATGGVAMLTFLLGLAISLSKILGAP